MGTGEAEGRTSCLRTPSVDSGAGHQHIVNDGKDTFACDPGAIFMFDPAIVQNGRLVQADAAAMDGARKGYLIRVEVLPA